MKIIARIRGGLGNQLFCYAAARRLSLANNAELVIDDTTGFVRDSLYRRRYMLDRFHIEARRATPAERLEPFERYRRGVMKWLSRRKPFAERQYLEEEVPHFDERLLTLKVDGTLYLDGLWQSERYFQDVESTIRDDLRIIAPSDPLNRRMGEEIRNSRAVAVHVRWFDAPGSVGTYNVSGAYYQSAIALIEEKVDLPSYFVFSDEPETVHAKIDLPEGRVTYVSHNRRDENAYADLWLMTQCQHFITANSTFSWWGAWLADGAAKIVVRPEPTHQGSKLAGWSLIVQLPCDRSVARNCRHLRY